MEIALTADVAVAQGLVVGRLVKKSAIKAVLEDRTDRGDGASLDQDAASAGGIDARVVVAPGQRQDAEAGAKALLGMRPCSDDGLEKRRGRGTDLLAGGDQPSRRPFAVAAMGARHMIGDRGVATPVGRTGVARDPLTLVEDLDRLVGDADIDEFTDQAVRGGIPMAIDLDVIVGRDAATLPARIELPGVGEDGMSGRNGQRKPGTTRGSPRRSRTAKASRISRHAVKSRCAREWGGWGRLSDDDPRQNNSGPSEDP